MILKRGFGGILIITGLVILGSTELGITGFVIAEKIGTTFTFIFGLALIIGGIGLMMSGSIDKDNLEKLVSDSKNLSTIPSYTTLNEGISNSSEGELFKATVYNKKEKRYDLGLFCYAQSKKEAARIASKFIPTGQPIYQFMDEKLRNHFGKKGKNINRRELLKGSMSKKEKGGIREDFIEFLKKNPLTDTRFKKVGFGVGQYDTNTGGRGWKKWAQYDPPHEELGIPYEHYNIHSANPNHNIHCLIINKKNKIKE